MRWRGRSLDDDAPVDLYDQTKHARRWLGRRFERHLDRLTERLGGPARRQVVLLLGLVLALNTADGSAIGALATQLEPGLHIGAAELGLLVTVSSLVGALAAIPCGVITDKTRRVRFLSLSILLWGAAEGVSGLATSFAMLLLTRLAIGAVTASAAPAVASLTGDYFPAGERGRIYGFIITGEVVGAGFGIATASLVSGLLGWRAAFIALAVPSIVLAWALWAKLPEPARGGQSRLEPGATEIVAADEIEDSAEPAQRDAAGADRSDDLVLRKVEEQGVVPDEDVVVVADPAQMTTWQVMRHVLRVRTNVTIIVASSLGYFFLAGLRTFAVVFASGQFRVGQGLATVVLAVIGLGAVGGLLVAGRLADGLVRRGRVDARIVVAAIGYLVAAALVLPALLSTSLVVSLPLLIVAAAAISAPNPPLDAAQLDVMPAQLWGRAQGIGTALRNSLEAIGPLLFGLLAEAFVAGNVTISSTADKAGLAAQTHGLQVAFLIMLAPLVGAGVLLLVMRRHYAVDVASAGKSERQGGAQSESRRAA